MAVTEGTKETNEKMPNFNFSAAECSLFFIHKLGSLAPNYLPQSNRFEELRPRLQFLNRGATAYERKLREEFENYEAKKLDLKSLDNKKKVICLLPFLA